MSAAVLSSTPYKGLASFLEEDAPFFFGRLAETEIIAGNLMSARLTLLYGASGVGKTSILRAGVVHYVQQLALKNLKQRHTPELGVVLFGSWRDMPLAMLEKCIHDQLSMLRIDAEEFPLLAPTFFLEFLESRSKQIGGDLLIILDQFEEYFLYHPQEDGPGTFAYEFPRAVNNPDLRVNFLISMREDALAKLDRFKGRIPNLFENYLRLEHLDRNAACAAIVKPLEQYNRLHMNEQPIIIDPGLVDAVLDQVKTGSVLIGDGRGVVKRDALKTEIETPYLQLVMTRLWEETRRAGSQTLKLETLSQLGGAERIVKTHLDQVMATLSDNECEICARIFRYLVTPAGTKIAFPVQDIASYERIVPERLNTVLEKLSSGNARILREVPAPQGSSRIQFYEIFHDVLATAVLDWRARFIDAQKHAEAQARIAQERRKTSRLAWALVAVTLILIVMIGLVIYAWTQQRIAFSRELASNALNQFSIDPELSLLLSVEAVQNWQTSEAQDTLRSLLQLPNREILRGHVGSVASVSYSPDGKFIVTAGSDKTVRVWQVGTGQQVHVLQHSGAVNSAEFSPTDGNRVVTASENNMATLWDLNSEQEIPLLGHTGSVQKATFSQDGKHIATASQDGTVCIFDATTGTLITKLIGHNGPVMAVAFSKNASLVLTASSDRTARIWNLSTGETISKLDGHTDGVNTASYDPTERFIVTASNDKTARVWNASTGTQIAILSGHEVWVNTAQFSPDGNYIVTASADSTARVWETFSGKEVARLSEHTGPVNEARFTLTGDRIITVSSDGKIYNWEWRLRNSKSVFYGHENETSHIAFSPNGEFFATASLDGTARVWQTETGPLFDLPAHNAHVMTALFSPDGRYILDASEDKTAFLWEVTTQRNFILSGHQAPLTTAVFSNDGKLIATSSEDGSAIIWNVESKQVKTRLSGHTGSVTWVNFAPSSKLVVTASADKTARIWDVDTGKVVFELVGHTGLVRMAVFSPDGTILITASNDGTAKIWNVSTGQLLFDLKDHVGPINYVDFSPDGKFVVTAGEDKTVRVWDVVTGHQVKRLLGHQQRVNKAIFSPDGKQIVTASNDNTARVWDVANEREVARLVMPRPITIARFSSDGQFVVTASENNAAYIWNSNTGRILQALVGHTAIVQSAVFSPDNKFIVTSGWDGFSRVFRCQVCSPINDLLQEAIQRVSRSLTCKERQTFLHQHSCP